MIVSKVILLEFAPSIMGSVFSVPFGIRIFVAIGCLFSGQMGAALHNRLDESAVMGMLLTLYCLVGCQVIARPLLLGAVC